MSARSPASRPRAVPQEPVDERLGMRQRQRIATHERIYQTALDEFENAGFAAAQYGNGKPA